MNTFEGEHAASTLSLPRKVFAVLMSIVLVVGLNPIVKAPEAAYAANMKVANTELTEGEEAAAGDAYMDGITADYTISEDKHAASFSNVSLTWYEKDASIGRNSDGWWIGAKVYAPSYVDEAYLNSHDIWYKNGPNATEWKSFKTNKDGVEKGRYYMQVWGLVTPEYVKNALAAGANISYEWDFAWDDDKNGDLDAFTFTVDPKTVTLLQDNEPIVATTLTYNEDADEDEEGSVGYFTSFEEAMAAANDYAEEDFEATLDVIHDFTFSKDVTVTEDVTLNLYGHKGIYTGAGKGFYLKYDEDSSSYGAELNVYGNYCGEDYENTKGDDGSIVIEKKKSNADIAWAWSLFDVEANTTLNLNGGTYGGNTMYGRGLIYLDVSEDQYNVQAKETNKYGQVLLNDVTASSNYSVLTSDSRNGWYTFFDVKVNGGKFERTGVANESEESDYYPNPSENAMYAGKRTLTTFVDAGDPFGEKTFFLNACNAEFKDVEITSNYGPCVEISGPAKAWGNEYGLAEATFSGDNKFQVTNTFDTWYNSALAISNDAPKVVVNGGSYTGVYGAYIFSSGGHVTITDGVFSGTSGAYRSDLDSTYLSLYGYTADTSIEGGKFSGKILTGGAVSNTISVKGGVFSENPEAYVESGYAAYETGDSEYPYAIGKKMAVTATGYDGFYDGAEHGITVNVTDSTSGATIMYGTSEGDYSLDEAPKYKDAGTYTVYYKVTAEGYVPVTGSETVKIDKIALKAEDFNNIENQTYTGGQIKPEVSPAENAGLSAGDYQVIYAENTNAGTDAGYAVITGKGNYSGIVTKRFTIEPASLSVDMIDVDESYAYTGSEIAEAKVLFNGVELKNGVDYVASYENNTQPGTATVEVIGLDGNFTGNASKTFKITRSAEQVKVTPAENVPQVSYSTADTTVPRDDAYTVSGTFGTVVYSLGEGYEGSVVNINALTGELTVAANTAAGEYGVPVSVVATEGESSSVGTATVKVKVVEAPSALKVAASGSTFKTLTYSKTAQAVAEVGTDYTVTGTSGGDLIYAKTLGPDSISVDEETGKITAAAGLPAGSYYVGVLAYDQGVEGEYQAGMGQVNFFVQVKKADSDMTVAAVKTAPSVKYATKEQTIAASKAVTVNGNSGAVTYSATTTSTLTMAADGKITVPAKTNVDSYTLEVTVTDPGDANHTGTTATVPVTVKVTKAASTLAVTAKGTTKKPVAIKIGKAGAGAAVTNVGQGTLSVQNASKNATAKKLTVKYDSKKKAINVTVPKKGVKKGTYPVIVRVKAAGNGNYSAGDKSITTYIKVS